MQKIQLKVGSRVIARGPIGYVRVDKNLIQRANPGCNGVRNNAYHGTIQKGDSVYVVTGIVGTEFEMKTEDGSEIRKGLDTITMRWCHQLDWAPALPKAETPIQIVSIKRETTEPESDTLDGMLAELDSLANEMNHLATVRVRYNKVKDKITATLGTKLKDTTLSIVDRAI